MAFHSQGGTNGGMPVSPGGFEFGLQGWSWPEPVPCGITFFLNNTVMVTDQFGRAIRGAEVDGKRVFFAVSAPRADDPEPGFVRAPSPSGSGVVRMRLATHAEAVAALEAERVDWVGLNRAGWPQLDYASLKKLPGLPAWPFDAEHNPATGLTPGRTCNCVVCAVRDPEVRKAALRARAEAEEAAAREMEAAYSETPAARAEAG